ncbi:hypothetical protein RQP46_007345 [Phenoliferia psychrophenolica]
MLFRTIVALLAASQVAPVLAGMQYFGSPEAKFIRDNNPQTPEMIRQIKLFQRRIDNGDLPKRDLKGLFDDWRQVAHLVGAVSFDYNIEHQTPRTNG